MVISVYRVVKQFYGDEPSILIVWIQKINMVAMYAVLWHSYSSVAETYSFHNKYQKCWYSTLHEYIALTNGSVSKP